MVKSNVNNTITISPSDSLETEGVKDRGWFIHQISK